MDLSNTGLVLEGGGLRGVFTSGVLQFLMEENIWFPYVIGVSMGACNGASYISRQTYRNRKVNIDFVNDPRYLSYRRLILKGELFGMDFIFNIIPNGLVPFDYDTFYNSDQKNWVVVTDCVSGEAVYYESKELGTDYLHILQASSSLPFIARPVKYDNRILMDGGLSDSIPVKKSIEHSNTKNIIILTRPKGYRKSRSNMYKLAMLRYPKYRGLQDNLKNRWKVYNDTLDFIEESEAAGKLFVIRPETDLDIDRAERKKDKLFAGYDYGYECMRNNCKSMLDYLMKPVFDNEKEMNSHV